MRKAFVVFLLSLMLPLSAHAACTADQIDVLGDGTQCETTKFSVTTTSDTTSLVWTMTAVGTFYADCGDGGTLSQDTSSYGTISGNTITRTGTSMTTYTCTWPSAGAHTIRFGGTATNYNIGSETAAISFYKSGGTQAKIASVSGNMSAMFPYITGESAIGAQPRFYRTFYNATNLTSIPGTLFANYTTGASYMFYYTFRGCTGLTSIPAELFSGITTGASYMFSYTFQRCTGLTSIPATLFSGITTGANYMFTDTFRGCTGLTSIPATLFSGITTGAQSMFFSTFYGCTNLSGFIPPTTFAGLIANGSPTASNMWSNTFYNTNLVTTCPTGTQQYITGYEGTGATTWNGKVSCACEESGYTWVNGACVVACNGVMYRDTCHQRCPYGDGELHVGQYTHPLWADITNVPSPSVYIGELGPNHDGLCYAYLEPDDTPVDNHHGFHTVHNGVPYHAINLGLYGLE